MQRRRSAALTSCGVLSLSFSLRPCAGRIELQLTHSPFLTIIYSMIAVAVALAGRFVR